MPASQKAKNHTRKVESQGRLWLMNKQQKASASIFSGKTVADKNKAAGF
jgi:hypothetical protein